MGFIAAEQLPIIADPATDPNTGVFSTHRQTAWEMPALAQSRGVIGSRLAAGQALQAGWEGDDMNSWLLAAALALTPDAAPPLAAPVQPPAREAVMTIPPGLRAQFQQSVLGQGGSGARRLERLVDFMFSADGLGMAYQHDATYTVEEAYRTRKANCLTFTLLAIALAREAGLEAHAQEIEETLAWRQEHDTIYRTNHVNAGIRVGHQRYTIDVAWDTLIARDPPEPISDQRLLGLYYGNRAVELMAEDRRGEADLYMAMALALDPDYAPGWSNAGVLYLRNGDPDAAEQAYLRALALQPMQAAALFNLVGLYQRSGRQAQAVRYQKQLESVRIKDPFHHFLLALDYEKAGDYRRALSHYQRAIRLHQGEHRFHFGLARAYLQLGDARRAGRALTRAQALSEGTTRGLYQAKLDRLRQLGR
jgi:tetratricopeptide (TPR) repeat protein